MTLQAGEVVGLIGPNGSGKTTCLRVLAGLLRPQAGRIELDGRALGSFEPRARARLIGYLPQGAEVHWPLVVRDLVALGRQPHVGPWQRPGAHDRAAIAAALRAAEMDGLADRIVTRLSGGERMLAHIARLLAGEPRIVLADEPVAALDPAHQLRVMALLRAIAGGGGAVLLVLHDLTLAGRFCDRLVLLDAGVVQAAGAPAEVLTRANLARVYGVEVVDGAHAGERFIVPWRPVAAPDSDL
ncbi:MAG: ABC transporter ATP-binding protein [Gammaproteobacteria bacterium]|nr:ABC transporter ATP-binding protein [Gammaproteobacteria bacterium]